MLASLLDYAVRQIPRYKGLPPSLESFPISTKRMLLEDMPSHLSDDLGPEKDNLLRFLFDESRGSHGRHELSFSNQIIVEETSGSSGIPFRIPKTVAERSRVAFGIWKNRRKYDPKLNPSQFYPFNHEPVNFAAKGDPYDFRVENLDRLYADLSQSGIRWVHGEPRLFLGHAEQLSPETARTKSVCFAESSGYHISNEERQIIETKLQVKLIDQYGCREAWVIGTRDHNGGFAVLSENVLVELVDSGGKPIVDPGVAGHVVVTCLHQRILPFIRYQTGDMGRWEDGVGQVVRLLDFRESNTLKLAGHDVNGHEFFKTMLAMAYRTIGHVNLRYVQIRRKEADRFVFATSLSPRAQMLCDAVAQASKWQPGFPPDAHFELQQLTDAEIAKELVKKPTLFTTKYMPPGQTST